MAAESSDSGSGSGSDKLAARLAMTDAPSDEAREYLREQTELTRLQKKNLVEQNAFEISHLRWRRATEWMSGVLRICMVFIGLLVVVGIGMAIWNAAIDKGLTIEAFSVPPDFTQRGITGEVVANKLLDRLADFQQQTQSNRAASSYENNWGDNIKVQIPNTGISIGEANRYLHQWLGKGTRITGEIYRMSDGKIAVTARAGAEASPTFTGSEADLDKLVTKAAEAVYRATQPYRYASYLSQQGRGQEAQAIYRRLIATGPFVEKLWGHIGLRWEANKAGRPDIGAKELSIAIARKPDFSIAWIDLMDDEGALHHEEGQLRAARGAVRLNNRDASVSSARIEQYRLASHAGVASALGDFLEVERTHSRIAQLSSEGDLEANNEIALQSLIVNCGALHDGGCLRKIIKRLPQTDDVAVKLQRRIAIASAQLALAQYSVAAAQLGSLVPELRRQPSLLFHLDRNIYPALGLTQAQRGDFKAAHAWMDRSPLDCSSCLRMRGTMAGLEKNWRGADYWFARAVRAAPSVPFNYTDWGVTLLAKGDVEGAIAKFRIANQKGPRFADPLAMWGEALIAKNRSDLALAKFEEANSYAPNWGRLHLKWGEALLWSGNKQDAKKHFVIASRLDLSEGEASELGQMADD
jgi:tetratricopeptide (TPR) repeat protein